MEKRAATKEVSVRDALPDDLPGILALYNHAVRETTAIWNETPSDLEGRKRWMSERLAAGFPVLVAEADGAFAGYGTYGPFRPHEGYRETVENSVYVTPDMQGQGIGRALLDALMARARSQKLHVMGAGIEAGNAASLALHAACGFSETARMPEIGRKFGRRLDLVLMQKMLSA